MSDETPKRTRGKPGLNGLTPKQHSNYMREHRKKTIRQILQAENLHLNPYVTKDELMGLISIRLRDGSGHMRDFRVLAELYASLQGYAYPTLTDQATRLLAYFKEKKSERDANKEKIVNKFPVERQFEIDHALDPFDAVRELESED